MRLPNQPDFPPDVPYARKPASPSEPRGRVYWGGTLIFCCLVLGMMASLVQYERQRVGDARAHVEDLQTSLSAGESQREDLGELMADPRTRLVRLVGSDDSPIHSASLAWNPVRRAGALFCDKLPVLSTGQRYEIWFVNAAANACLASIVPQPGVSVYPFHPDFDPGDKNRVEITAGPRSASAAPMMTGDIQ